MLKHQELSDPNSCLNRAKSDEYIFVLVEHDEDTPGTIRDWGRRRVQRRKNQPSDPQILKALADANAIEQNLQKKALGRTIEELELAYTHYKKLREEGKSVLIQESGRRGSESASAELMIAIQAVIDTHNPRG